MKEDIKKRALHRSKIIQGQIRGVEKMIEQDEYCMDILTQSLAIQKSLSSLNKLIAENHIATHIKEQFAAGANEQALQELMDIYELNNRRSK